MTPFEQLLAAAVEVQRLLCRRPVDRAYLELLDRAIARARMVKFRNVDIDAVHRRLDARQTKAPPATPKPRKIKSLPTGSPPQVAGVVEDDLGDYPTQRVVSAADSKPVRTKSPASVFEYGGRT